MGIFSRLSDYAKNSYVKDGKGVKKKKITDKERYSLFGFFRTYKDRFWQILTLNLLYLLFTFPVVFALAAFMGVADTESLTPTNVMFAPLYGAHLCSPNAATNSLMGIFGTQISMFTSNNTTLLFYAISLIVLFTFGIANTGMTYVLRGYTRGDSVFMWQDFFHAIKRNFWSSLIMGFCDIVLMFMLAFSSFYHYYNAVNISYSIMFFVAFAMAVVYFIMRFYIYLLLITFRLSPVKLIKNALILSLIGIKRNVMAVIGIAVMVLLNIVVFMFWANMGLMLPFFFLMASGSFMSCFAAYPNVKKYMIDPYYEEHPEEKDLEITDEPIFLDYT